MIKKIDGRVAITGGFVNVIVGEKDIILTVDVIGTYFPTRVFTNNNSIFTVRSQDNVSNKIYIDYQDGTGEHEYDFKASGNTRRITFSAAANSTNPVTITEAGTYNVNALHFFQDLPDGVKNTVNDAYGSPRPILIRFQKPASVIEITFNRVRLYNQLPSALSKFVNLMTLSISSALYLNSFMQDFFNSRIRSLTISNAGPLMNNGVPIWALNSPISSLNLSSSANLSGSAISKRLDLIYRLKDTLTSMFLASTQIDYRLPEEWNQLYKLNNISLSSNNSPNMRFPNDLSGFVALEIIYMRVTRMPFSELERVVQGIPSLKTVDYKSTGFTTDNDFAATNSTLETIEIGDNTWNAGAVPSFIGKLTGLKTLSLFGVSGNLNTSLNSWGNFSGCVNLVTINASRVTTMPDVLPGWFSSLTKLKNIIAPAVYGTQARVNNFVDSVYSLVTANAPITGTSANAFRSMSIDIYGSTSVDTANSVRPSGTYQQPAGYSAGVSNGAPANQMQKIWIMTNQYGHVWTVKP